MNSLDCKSSRLMFVLPVWQGKIWTFRTAEGQYVLLCLWLSLLLLTVRWMQVNYQTLMLISSTSLMLWLSVHALFLQRYSNLLIWMTFFLARDLCTYRIVLSISFISPFDVYDAEISEWEVPQIVKTYCILHSGLQRLLWGNICWLAGLHLQQGYILGSFDSCVVCLRHLV